MKIEPEEIKKNHYNPGYRCDYIRIVKLADNVFAVHDHIAHNGDDWSFFDNQIDADDAYTQVIADMKDYPY